VPVIIPGSVIEALLDFAGLLKYAQDAGYLHDLLPRAMPWVRPLSEDDRHKLVSDLAEAAASGDHAPERLAVVMREWRETAEILGDPQAMASLAESAEAIAEGDVIRGRDAVRALRPQR
jgi:hypothetical protein